MNRINTHSICLGYGILVGTGCILPTDRSSEVHVEIDGAEQQLIVGERTTLTPRLVDASGVEIAGAHFAFRAFDEGVVAPKSDGTVLAVGVGTSGVAIEALEFDGATPDTAWFRVLDNVQIDAVTPDTVRFGDILTVVGTALDPGAASLIAIGAYAAPVSTFVPADPNDGTSRDTLRIFVPANAATRSDVVVLRTSGAVATATIHVEQFDRYEPNDEAPARITSVFSVTNPQLAFEATPVAPYDWYRFGLTSGTFTIEVRPRFPTQKFVGRVTVHSPTASRGDRARWSVSAMDDLAMCRGLVARQNLHRAFVDFDVTNEPVFFPFMDVSLDSFDLAIEMLSAPFDNTSYAIVVHDRYRSDFTPDSFEENDYCEVAPLVGDGVQATLTLDNAYDVDWFRLSLESESIILAQIDCLTCGSLETGGFRDVADIDILLYQDTESGLPSAPSDLPIVATGSRLSSEFERLDATVPAGDYLLLIHNTFYTAVEEMDFSLRITPITANAGQY